MRAGARQDHNASMNPPPGVHSRTIRTSRLNMHFMESGPSDGIRC